MAPKSLCRSLRPASKGSILLRVCRQTNGQWTDVDSSKGHVEAFRGHSIFHFYRQVSTTMTMMMQRQCPAFFLLVACLLSIICSCSAFAFPGAQREKVKSALFVNERTIIAQRSMTPRRTSTSQTLLYARDDDYYDDDARERVRVPRGGRRRRFNDDEDEEFEERRERRYYDEDDDDDDEYYDDDEEYDDEFDVDFEFNRVEVDEEYASDILIPNPILDNIDPDGAGERFGEIARDPTFWRDLILVIAIFNFCEYVAQVPYY